VTQFDTIFAVLQATGVRYVVVGGVAVNLHGYQRFTKDIDLVIELVPDRALKALQALEAAGYKPNVPVKLSDFFVQYPFDFDELWDQSTKIDLPDTSLRIASIDHLIQMKRKANRPQDLLDIKQLEKIKQILDE
jgi:hypothetical protein